ncbi:MAG: C40 family peptidase [Prochlorotrichaceae cyanobacterium]
MQLTSHLPEYQLQRSLNLYKTPACQGLVTQAAAERQATIVAEEAEALKLHLCEDDYEGWIPHSDRSALTPAPSPYQALNLSAQTIQERIPQIIEFCQAAQAQPHCYLWGGTIAPDYDCSGLMQAAFKSAGIWIPRDAYQQEGFAQPLPLPLNYPLRQKDLSILRLGDLIFFGTPIKATHVGLYLGQGNYIHSSGKDQGRNGIGIDTLLVSSDTVSQTYGQQLRGAGRITNCYVPGLRT